MSIGQTFPDVLDLGGGLYRIITDGGFWWVDNNTSIKAHGSWDNIPRELVIPGDNVVANMQADGVIVRQAPASRRHT